MHQQHVVVNGKSLPPGQDYVLMHDDQIGVVMRAGRDDDGDPYIGVIFDDEHTEAFYDMHSMITQVHLRDGSIMSLREYLAKECK